MSYLGWPASSAWGTGRLALASGDVSPLLAKRMSVPSAEHIAANLAIAALASHPFRGTGRHRSIRRDQLTTTR